LREAPYAKHRDVVRLRSTLGEGGYFARHEADQILAAESAAGAQYGYQAIIGQVAFGHILGLGYAIGVEEK
jgi:hypothetical protein